MATKFSLLFQFKPLCHGSSILLNPLHIRTVTAIYPYRDTFLICPCQGCCNSFCYQIYIKASSTHAVLRSNSTISILFHAADGLPVVFVRVSNLLLYLVLGEMPSGLEFFSTASVACGTLTSELKINSQVPLGHTATTHTCTQLLQFCITS